LDHSPNYSTSSPKRIRNPFKSSPWPNEYCCFTAERKITYLPWQASG
jgi:hypothetical protein